LWSKHDRVILEPVRKKAAKPDNTQKLTSTVFLCKGTCSCFLQPTIVTGGLFSFASFRLLTTVDLLPVTHLCPYSFHRHCGRLHGTSCSTREVASVPCIHPDPSSLLSSSPLAPEHRLPTTLTKTQLSYILSYSALDTLSPSYFELRVFRI